MCGPERGRRPCAFVGLAGAALALTTALLATPARAAEEPLVEYKSISPDLALDVARATLDKCRKDGLQVAVVVMDRFGQTLVLLRDRYAGLPAPTTAASKAYTALSFKMASSAFAQGITEHRLSAELAHLPNIVMMAGGLLIEAGGQAVGAVGVSGAPGGDKDEACAQAGVDAVRDKLDFQ